MANHDSGVIFNPPSWLQPALLFMSCAVLSATLSAQNGSTAAPITGFSPAHAADESKLEVRFKSAISTDRIRDYHRYFTSKPHPAGTKNDYEVAQYIAGEWKKQGLEDVVIRQYDVLGTRPVSTMLEMVTPKKYQAVLREQPYNIDPDTKNPDIASAWIGFSSSGEVTAPVVYAHSGNPRRLRASAPAWH